MKTFFLMSLGCNKNLVDSEMMIYKLENHGYIEAEVPEESDILIINTCAFIDSAQEEAVNTILEAAELKKEGMSELLIVTGCLSQKFNKELLDGITEIDAVLGTSDFLDIVSVIDNAYNHKVCKVTNPEHRYMEIAERKLLTPNHSAYLKIAEGCNNCCSYCTIPEFRGPYRSRPKDIIIKEAVHLVNRGVKEITLIAQDTSLYGLDLNGEVDLANLLDELAKIEGLRWLRFLYCYPTRISERLLDVISRHSNICDYIDMPLQHVNEKILKSMNREGDFDSLYKIITNIRKKIPNITLRTTFMVGFPGETGKEFEELLKFIKTARFDWAGIFTFSPQENTPAYKLPQGDLSQEKIIKRADILSHEQQKITAKKNALFIDRVIPVLVEGVSEESSDFYYGRSENQAPEVDGVVFISGLNDDRYIGSFVMIRITHADKYDLIGEYCCEYCK